MFINNSISKPVSRKREQSFRSGHIQISSIADGSLKKLLYSPDIQIPIVVYPKYAANTQHIYIENILSRYIKTDPQKQNKQDQSSLIT